MRFGCSAITSEPEQRWPPPAGAPLGFTLRARIDNQAVSWLCTKRDINRFHARWLDKIEEFRFGVEHTLGCFTSPTH